MKINEQSQLTVSRLCLLSENDEGFRALKRLCGWQFGDADRGKPGVCCSATFIRHRWTTWALGRHLYHQSSRGHWDGPSIDETHVLKVRVSQEPASSEARRTRSAERKYAVASVRWSGSLAFYMGNDLTHSLLNWMCIYICVYNMYIYFLNNCLLRRRVLY